MEGFIIVVVVVVGIVLVVNGKDIVNAIRTPKPKHPARRIQQAEFALTKPAGFTVSSEPGLFMIQSVEGAGAAMIVDGRSVHERFNCAWAAVSITPGDGIELCRNVATGNDATVIEESEATVDGNRVLTLTVERTTPARFVIRTTHKVVLSAANNKTYELRVSGLKDRLPAYGRAMSQILESFEVLPVKVSV